LNHCLILYINIMFVIKGKHTIAKVYLSNESDLEDNARAQIQLMVDHRAFTKAMAIMPDCHKGAGSVIGFTAPVGDLIIPNVIGVDIGCGMLAVNLGKLENFDRKGFDEYLQANIPAGCNVRENSKVTADKIPSKIEMRQDFVNMLKGMVETCDKIKKGLRDYAYQSLGTLGGGNHFIEVDVDPEGDHWLVIHTGSRNFGKKVAEYHQHKAKILCDMMHVDVPAGMEYLPIEYGGKEYLDDMKIAQEYAKFNRKIIADILTKFFYPTTNCFEVFEEIESVHNYINFTDKIIRKGAISAHKGEKILIPLNMSAGIIVAEGKSNINMNFSAPHGAGRLFGRAQATKTLSMEDFKKSMEGIYTSCISEKTLDESPNAYKDPKVIYDNINETCEVLFTMKPVYNFKATEEEDKVDKWKKKKLCKECGGTGQIVNHHSSFKDAEYIDCPKCHK